MRRCLGLLAAWAILTANSAFGQAFFDVRKLAAPPPDFNPSVEGDYVLADYQTHPVEDFTVSRFKVGVPGGIGGLTLALDETFVGIGPGGFRQTTGMFPHFRIADDKLSVDMYGAILPQNTYFEVVHSTPYAIRANLLGDANHDGGFSVVDIDLTNQSISTGGSNPTFDLNFDNAVNFRDTEHLVEVLIGTRLGDVDLDFTVSRRDTVQLAKFYGATSGVGWAQGNLDGAGGVSLRDLAHVSRNFGFGGPPSPGASASVAAVPEPATVLLLALGVLTYFVCRRQASSGTQVEGGQL